MDPYFMSDYSQSPGGSGNAPGGLGEILDGGVGDADGVDEGSTFRTQKDAVIFAVDARGSMFQNSTKGDGAGATPPFHTAIMAALQFAQDKGVTSEKDLAGLVLFGTEKANNAYGFPQVYVFHEMDSINLPRVVELETLARAAYPDHPMHKEFREAIGHCDDKTVSSTKSSESSSSSSSAAAATSGDAAAAAAPSTSSSPLALSDLLWTLLHLFNQPSVRKTAFKRVFLFTDDDDPCRGKPLERARAMARAKDLKEHGISLDVYHWGRSPSHPLAGITGGGAGAVLSLTGSSGGSGGGSIQSSSSASGPVSGSTPHQTGSLTSSSGGGSDSGGATKSEKVFRPDFWAQLLTVADHQSMMQPYNSGSQNSGSFSSYTPYLGELIPVSEFQGAEVRVRTYPIRSIASLRLGVGVGAECPGAAVRVFLPVSKCAKRSFSWLEAATNQAITSETRYKDPANGAELSRADFHKALPVGKVDTVRFDASEVDHIRSQVSTPGIRIVGFRPASEARVSPEFNTGRSAFLGVDRSQISSGSDSGLKFFVALNRELIRKDQVAIAEVTARASGTPRLAALIPATATNSAPEGVSGCGFHVWMLPYADDLRDVKVTTSVAAPPTAAVDAAGKVVDALTQRDVAPDFAPSPAIQKQLFILQQHVLQDSSAEPPGDKTLPDIGGMRKVAGKLFNDFKVATWGSEDGYMAEVMAPLPAPKKPEPTKADIDALDFEDMVTRGTLASLTIPFLKAYLSQRGQPTDGRKADLVDRVTVFVEGKKRAREEEEDEP